MKQEKPARYRLYIDESGDHVFKYLEHPGHRYLSLLGCWFNDTDYRVFHEQLSAFKKQHIPHHPDEPPILHREEIVNRRGHFSHLQDPVKNQEFDDALLKVIIESKFHVVGVVIDKLALRQKYGDAAAHPYHLALGFLLQRYCGYMNHINRYGDVMAESRGKREDFNLKDSYARIYNNGVWITKAHFFQNSLTSKELKVKKKSANISGLQLADLLVNPVRQIIMKENGHLAGELAAFVSRLLPILDIKYNRHIYTKIVEGYGKVFYPK